MRKELFIFFLSIAAFQVHAYELNTHAHLTQQAYYLSGLNTDIGLLADLNLDKFDAEKPFGENYLDISGIRIEERIGKDFSRDRMPEGVKPFSIQGWLMRGAIREDDLGLIDVLLPPLWIPFQITVGTDPHDDPYGPIFRVFNHFYDPINDKPLNGFPLTGNNKAPDWAIGSSNAFSNPVNPEQGRRNHFTVFDAREAQYRAITGRDKNWNPMALTQTAQNKYWATLFRSLGDVVHLVQDMGQPQHTRNDPHAGGKFDGSAPFRGHKSVYEAYIEARAKGEKFEVNSTGGATTSVSTQPLKYTGYPLPIFNDYVSYFSTRHLDGTDPLARRGLADYSNRGFFTAGTNFGNTGNYQQPNPDPSAYIRGFLTTDWKGDPLPSTGAVEIIRGDVSDTLTGSQDRARLSTYGLWDQFLEQQGATPQYTLSRANYDDMADLLIPRAVAYSAGLLNHFFRGRIEPEIEQYSGGTVTMKIINRSLSDTLFELSGVNELAVVYTYQDTTGEKYGVSVNPVSLASGDDIAAGEKSAQAYIFDFNPAIPIDAQDLKLQIVYRGKLGNEEDGIAVGSIEMSSPGFIFTPSSVPADGITGTRHMLKQNGQWVLTSEQGLVFGNIDWKGWYVNGKPTKIISWQGPRSRYFPGSPGFSSNIYHNGELFSVAPYAVLGVAMNKDTSGNIWVVAICQNGTNDVVLRRPFTKSTSSALYDAVLHPEGWSVLGDFPLQAGHYAPDRAWFFNGSGTEAQTMRRTDVPLSNGLERIKVVIGGTSATIEYLGNLAGASLSGYAHGNGCISKVKVFSNCAGDASNPTGTRTRDTRIDRRYVRGDSLSGNYIVAVDYIDIKPTYAMLSMDYSFDEIRRLNTDAYTFYLCDSGGTEQSRSDDADSKSAFIQTKKRVLKLTSDNISGIAIESLDWERSIKRPNTFTRCPLTKLPFDVFQECSKEYHEWTVRRQMEVKRRVDYLDLRNGLALSSVETIDEMHLVTLDAVNIPINQAQAVVHPDELKVITSYEIYLNGEKKIFYSNSQNTQGNTIPALQAGSNWHNIDANLCARNLTYNNNNFQSLSLDMILQISSPIGSLVNDLNGNTFVSLQYQDSSNTTQVFSQITNGSPSSVTGIINPDATFYPIGLK